MPVVVKPAFILSYLTKKKTEQSVYFLEEEDRDRMERWLNAIGKKILRIDFLKERAIRR